MLSPNVRNKLNYLAWAAARWGVDRSCPACRCPNTVLVRRKYLVTALYRCEACCLLFRVPKPNTVHNDEFYQSDYSQGFTTDCPEPGALEALKRSSFRNSDKDFSLYAAILQAAGLRPGQVLFDFGASWGYGSWQLKQAGFRVYSFEISQPRSRYAAQNLDCEMFAPEQLPEKVDCLFSAHVIEHLVNPRILWDAAQLTLKPTGIIVLFTPNGEPARAASDKDYHRLWGLVHPLLLSAEALHLMAADYGYVGRAYSSPYQLAKVAEDRPGQLNGSELLFIARPRSEGNPDS